MLKHYVDFSPYEYYMTCAIPEVSNVGWLDKKHQFPTGTVEPGLLQKLKELIFKSYEGSCNILVNELWGSDECPICGQAKIKIFVGDDYFDLGSAELWIPNSEARNREHYFATSGLIIHYITDYHYQPPQEFIDAVLKLNSDSDFEGQSVRDESLRRCAGKK
jgi:hypothetical protein